MLIQVILHAHYRRVAIRLHVRPDIVKSALGVLAPMTVCVGIVNLNTIQTGPQLQSLLTALSNAANP